MNTTTILAYSAIIYIVWIAVNIDIARFKRMSIGTVILVSIVNPLIGWFYVSGFPDDDKK